ncbi:MAG: HAMP domain-containing sensor histidine kinase [Eubacteriales bacterium]|nr:HAMP domain-containing sensor histidine kinase [Eubacteriales bacterium]
MNQNLPVMALTAAVIILTVISVCTIVYFVKREQGVYDRIQKMLDDAVDGKFHEEHMDESKISAVENNMWRYLSDNEMYRKKLFAERDRIQALISDISHQAVTPISNITLYSQLLEEWLVSQGSSYTQDVCDEITAIREQVDKLDFLIESLVKLSRMETGIINVKVKKQKIQPILSAVQNQFSPKAAQKGIVLKVVCTEESAVFDLKWTIEALANIVDNGIKYSPDGGEVFVKVEPYIFFVRIDVEDHGLGIPEEEQANIFTRFYRSSGVSDKPGLGIGLYIAREVIKAQNGYIKVTSKNGEGSTFSLFLPKEEIS